MASFALIVHISDYLLQVADTYPIATLLRNSRKCYCVCLHRALNLSIVHPSCQHAEHTPNVSPTLKMATSQQPGSLTLSKHASVLRTLPSHIIQNGRTNSYPAFNVLKMRQRGSTISLTSLVKPSQLRIMEFARTLYPLINLSKVEDF